MSAPGKAGAIQPVELGRTIRELVLQLALRRGTACNSIY